MVRYSRILEEVYSKTTLNYVAVSPGAFFSKHVKNKTAKKILIYLEKYPIFMCKLAIVQMRTKFSHVHFADHGDSIQLWAIWRTMMKICTVHDQFAIQASLGCFPEVRLKLTGKFYQSLNKASISKFHTLLCVSRETELVVQRIYPNLPTEIFSNCLDPVFVNLDNTIKKSKFQNNDYLLIVNNYHWRKNRLGSIRVWNEIRNVASLNLELLIIGDPLHETERTYLEENKLVPFVKVISGVQDQDLARYYANAYALIFMTFHEGFGYPIIESNACGVLAVCSDLPVLKEVTGTFNIFLPNDFENVNWKEILEKIHDPILRDISKNHVIKMYSIDQSAKRLESLDCFTSGHF